MTEKEIKKLYSKYHVPKNVISHMRKVCKICRKLILLIKKKKFKIDEKLVITAAKIHDLLRVCDIKNFDDLKADKNDLIFWDKLKKKYGKLGHIKALCKILKKEKKNNLAKLIEKHDFFAVNKLKSLEEKILYYADKRVDGDKIVELKERFKSGRKRNRKENDNKKIILETEKKALQLETDLKRLLGDFKL